MQVVDSLEPRVLLTDGIPGIPSTAQAAFTEVNQFVQGSIAANVDARFQQYLEKAGLNSPTELADQLRDVNSRFQQVAGNTPSGTALPAAEFGSDLKNFFQAQTDQFSGQIESLVPDMNAASPRKVAVLPTPFAPGTLPSMYSYPGMSFSYSSPSFVFGMNGSASVPQVGPRSVNLESLLEYNNPSIPAGAVDRFRQKAKWTDSENSAGTLIYEVNRNKTSADGLSSISYGMEVTHHEFSPTSVYGVFHQRDGAWIRDVTFHMTGDVVSMAKADLSYIQDGKQITVSYQDLPSLPDADRRKMWTGFASREDEVLGNPVKFIGKTQHFEDGDRSALFSTGTKYGESWGLAGAAQQVLDGQPTEHIIFVGYYLKHDILGPNIGIGVSSSYSLENGWTGATPQYMNYFVPTKDKVSLFFEVQNLGDSMEPTVRINITP